MKDILEVQNLSKRFRINHLPSGYLSLRDKLTAGLSFKRESREEFWALNDISFQLPQGQAMGIIGRNGAGKSTLLKILSRITPPTKGKVISRGRIASLLEVGTGFHHELTGRENIFFNGSLLGMKKSEILSRFDEIVDFSGVEKFLDTPLKHYSSGMQLRLAFSVAAFLDPEILIIDEVLAVGDAEFQRRCLGKMEDVSNSGRSLLFVSHQLGLVSKLCKQAILLDKGRLVDQGPADVIVNTYMDKISVGNEFTSAGMNESRQYFFQHIRTLGKDQEPAVSFAHDSLILISVAIYTGQLVRDVHLLVSANNKNGQRIFSSDISLDKYEIKVKESNTFILSIPGHTLTPGTYSFFAALHSPNALGYDVKDQVCPINIYDNGSEFATFENKWFYGDVFVKCEWRLIAN